MTSPASADETLALVEPPPEAAGVPYPLPPELLPQIDHLVTEDDTPVDNIFSEKQQRLLVEPLYNSWKGGVDGRTFVAASNVGVFVAVSKPPVVPDAFVSMDVTLPQNLMLKKNRSYLYWEYGKPPEIAIEIVSNTEGNELGSKLRDYAQMNVLYYVVYDPELFLKAGVLNVYLLNRKSYQKQKSRWFPEIGLGLTLWEGKFEDTTSTWLRWCDEEGQLIPTGAERAAAAEQQAEAERERAAAAEQQAEAERERAEAAQQENAALKARLRELGVEM